MTYLEQITSIMNENNGFVTSMELTKLGIPRIYLKKLRDDGVLEMIDRGIYIDNNCFEDEMYVLQCKYSKGIFSHDTALFIHGYSDRTPAKYTLTFPAGYHCSSLKKKNIIDKYCIKENYEIGIITVQSPFGNKINVYNLEKSLCDSIKAGVDIQIVNSAMRKYAQSKEKNLSLLFEYAEKIKVKKKVLNYMEVLL